MIFQAQVRSARQCTHALTCDRLSYMDDSPKDPGDTAPNLGCQRLKVGTVISFPEQEGVSYEYKLLYFAKSWHLEVTMVDDYNCSKRESCPPFKIDEGELQIFVTLARRHGFFVKEPVL